MPVPRDQQIAELRSSGVMNLAEIGKAYDLTREGVRLICNRMGVDPGRATAAYAANRESWRDRVIEGFQPQVEKMYAEGAYYGEICDAIGIPHSRVVDIVSEIDNEFVKIARQVAMHKRNQSENKIRPPNLDDPRTRWTPDKIIDALAQYARDHHDGRLPPNLKYQKDAAGNIDLPSSATVRNTVGKWSEVRQKIIAINEENAT